MIRPMDEPFRPFDRKWDRPQLEGADLRLRSSFEWWYFDLQTADGVSLVVVFSRKCQVFSRCKPTLYVEYKDRGRRLRRIRNYPASSFQWALGPARVEGEGQNVLRIGPNVLSFGGADIESLHYKLEVRTPEFDASLVMHPIHRGFLPSADGCYFRSQCDPSRRTCVSFSAPLMQAEGTLRFEGDTRRVSGRGYHDHPWGTEFLLGTHHRWNWGRLSDASRCAMFVDVMPMPGFDGALRFLWHGELGFEPQVSNQLEIQASDRRRDSWFGEPFPHALTVDSLGQGWTVHCTGSLLDVPVYNRSNVQWTMGGGSGTGWVEYFDLPPALRRVAAWGIRIVAFFWRPFPWCGQ